VATSIAAGITLWAYSTGWTATVLTPGLSSGASMAVRSDGTVHVAYSAGALHYATNAGGRWTDTLIDANGSRSNGPTASPALTIDAAGTIRVAYKCSDEQARDCIRIATEQGTEWTVETAVTANYLWQPFLAVDTNGQVHIVYTYVPAVIGSVESRIQVEYLARSNGSWNNSTVVTVYAPAMYEGVATDIAVDGQGNPYVAVSAAPTAGGIGYYARGTTGWEFHPLTNASSANDCIRMRTDGIGALHVAYPITSSGRTVIEYTTNAGGTWARTDLNADAAPDTCVALAVDSVGRVHVLYEGRAGALMHATNAAGDWRAEEVGDAHPESSASSGLGIGIGPGTHVHMVTTDSQPSYNRLLHVTNIVDSSNFADYFGHASPTVQTEVLVGVTAVIAVLVVERGLRWRTARMARRASGRMLYERIRTDRPP